MFPLCGTIIKNVAFANSVKPIKTQITLRIGNKYNMSLEWKMPRFSQQKYNLQQCLISDYLLGVVAGGPVPLYSPFSFSLHYRYIQLQHFFIFLFFFWLILCIAFNLALVKYF